MTRLVRYQLGMILDMTTFNSARSAVLAAQWRMNASHSALNTDLARMNASLPEMIAAGAPLTPAEPVMFRARRRMISARLAVIAGLAVFIGSAMV